MSSWKQRPFFIIFLIVIITVVGYSFYVHHRRQSAYKYYLNGQQLTRQRDFLNANLNFKRTLELDPYSENAPYARFVMASNYVALTAYIQAIREYERLIVDFPGHKKAADSRFMIGIVYKSCIGDNVKALENFKEYLKNYPNGKSTAEVRMYVERLEGAKE